MHVFTFATFVVGAVFVATDIGFDFALLRNYVHPVLAEEDCRKEYRNIPENRNMNAYFECWKKNPRNYPRYVSQKM